MQPEFLPPLPGLLAIAHEAVRDEVFSRLNEAGHPELRPTHSCVFGTIGDGGDRLTVLAERARMTKQAVGEVASELEALGVVERAPDPSDGRAKIIQLTERGRAAYELGMEVIEEIRQRWAERYGAERVRDMVELLGEIAGEARATPTAIRPAA
jgi:DNA-binding MarR family transcriptional regulator